MPEKPSELGIEVPVSAIEKELRKLWEEDEAQTNASLMNLVVYSEKRGALAENSAIVRDLTREHACRAILVEIDRSIEEPSLRSWITAHCHLSHGRKSVCCEQVAFHLTGRVTGRFRNTVFSHLNSDLPLIFWWQGELSDVFNERLAAVMERIIFDSSTWRDPAAGFATLEDASAIHSRLVLQDLAWTRTWQFRVSVAALFDDRVSQAVLPDLDTVTIVHHPDHRNSALQLLSWISTQAGWTEDDSSSPAKIRFASKTGGTIAATLTADAKAAPLGLLEIRGGGTVIRVSREAGSAFLTRQIEAPGYSASSLSPADPDAPADLVAQQLARGGKNSLFQKILPRFRQLLQS